jgi:hypothetical protein
MGPLRYLDVILIVVAAPILLLIGVPASGYAVAGGVWLVLRVIEIAMERYAGAMGDHRGEITLRLAFTMTRVFVLAIAVILVRKSSGQDAGLTALAVVVVAFTIHLIMSFAERPRSR